MIVLNLLCLKYIDYNECFFKAHLNGLSKLLNLYTVHINNLDLFHKMNFILKSALQNFIAILPNKIGDNLYFLLQKNTRKYF